MDARKKNSNFSFKEVPPFYGLGNLARHLAIVLTDISAEATATASGVVSPSLMLAGVWEIYAFSVFDCGVQVKG
ncbi:hypothetical protein DD238_002045 [Peronospora effusa]|uniref:Uncharacterized protein n=1 Tax=Peronospora effusa TaxID=542832 RepID=A0A3M6VB53_9STRA|nr:hypothetical protein DD238_007783 [Peronospora effusa]RMX69610.1 hypothetical protein DD238_002045 [Peronospora effusa]RQM11823.1 hypothetical protein DD237_008118 [Peronospora effusa]